MNLFVAWTNDPDVTGHVPINCYAVIMFKGHVKFYGEWIKVNLQ